MATKTRELTPDEKTACVNARRIWDAKKKQLGLTQEAAAAPLGLETQGAVNHLLNGRAPITVITAFKLAKLLECHPADIHPGVNELVGSFGDPALNQIMEMFALASPEARRAAVYMLYADITSDGQLPPGLAASKLLSDDSKKQTDAKTLKPS